MAMRRGSLWIALLACGMLASPAVSTSRAAESGTDSKPVNRVCPVMLETIEEGEDAQTVEFDGKTVALCCKRCVTKWKAMNAEARTAALGKALAAERAAQAGGGKTDGVLAAAEKAPVNETCPMCPKPAKADGPMSAFEGNKVVFCCHGCLNKWDDLKKDEKISRLTPVADFGPINAVCPVGNEPADLAITGRHDGRTLAFCCPSCSAAFGKWDEARRNAFYKGIEAQEIVNTDCPVAEHEINADGGVFLFAGKKVQLCCPDCVPKWLAWDNTKRTEALGKVLPKKN